MFQKTNYLRKLRLLRSEDCKMKKLHAQKSQEDAIRKILHQDSSKKKKEDQRKKRLEELAQMKASNTVRVVMAPTGTVVSAGENCIFKYIHHKTSQLSSTV